MKSKRGEWQRMVSHLDVVLSMGMLCCGTFHHRSSERWKSTHPQCQRWAPGGSFLTAQIWQLFGWSWLLRWRWYEYVWYVLTSVKSHRRLFLEKLWPLIGSTCFSWRTQHCHQVPYCPGGDYMILVPYIQGIFFTGTPLKSWSMENLV